LLIDLDSSCDNDPSLTNVRMQLCNSGEIPTMSSSSDTISEVERLRLYKRQLGGERDG
jgi:hypothetical protein